MDDTSDAAGMLDASLLSGQQAIFNLYRTMQLEYQDRAPRQWEVDQKDERGSVRVTVCDDSPYTLGLTGPLEIIVAKLIEILATIPEECRASATFDPSAEYSHGESYDHINIAYDRAETDEEWAARKADVERRMAIDMGRKRAEFERLRAELEPAPSPSTP